MCRYFVFKWFMRYNICTCPLCNPPMRLIYLHSIILADYKNRREKLLYEVSPFGFCNPPEWIRRMNSIRSRAKEMEKSFQSLV